MLRSQRAPSRHVAELVRAERLSPTVRGLVFRVADGPFDYVAGQWVDVELAGTKRAYSIASAPSAGDASRFELAVTRVENGPVSTALHALEVGARVDVIGPSGLFTREDAPRDRPLFFVGTGTGLAPLRALLHEELERDGGPRVTVLFGCRTEAEILWRDEFTALTAKHPRVRYEVTLSRADAAWTGRRGYVQAHLAELLAESASMADVYVCGLSKMVHDVREVLKKQLGLDRKQVHSERFD